MLKPLLKPMQTDKYHARVDENGVRDHGNQINNDLLVKRDQVEVDPARSLASIYLHCQWCTAGNLRIQARLRSGTSGEKQTVNVRHVLHRVDQNGPEKGNADDVEICHILVVCGTRPLPRPRLTMYRDEIEPRPQLSPLHSREAHHVHAPLGLHRAGRVGSAVLSRADVVEGLSLAEKKSGLNWRRVIDGKPEFGCLGSQGQRSSAGVSAKDGCADATFLGAARRRAKGRGQ